MLCVVFFASIRSPDSLEELAQLREMRGVVRHVSNAPNRRRMPAAVHVGNSRLEALICPAENEEPMAGRSTTMSDRNRNIARIAPTGSPMSPETAPPRRTAQTRFERHTDL